VAPGVGFQKCAGSECGSSQDWPKSGVLPQEYGRLEVREAKSRGWRIERIIALTASLNDQERLRAVEVPEARQTVARRA